MPGRSKRHKACDLSSRKANRLHAFCKLEADSANRDRVSCAEKGGRYVPGFENSIFRPIVNLGLVAYSGDGGWIYSGLRSTLG